MADQRVEEQSQTGRFALQRELHNARYRAGGGSREHLDEFYFAIRNGDARYQEIMRRRATGTGSLPVPMALAL